MYQRTSRKSAGRRTEDVYKRQIEDSSIMTEKRKKGESGPADVRTGVAFAPYVVLIAVTILLLVVTPVNQFLGQVSIGFSFPQTQTGLGFVNAASQRYSPFYPLIDSGTVLLITCIISCLLYTSRCV